MNSKEVCLHTRERPWGPAYQGFVSSHEKGELTIACSGPVGKVILPMQLSTLPV